MATTSHYQPTNSMRMAETLQHHLQCRTPTTTKRRAFLLGCAGIVSSSVTSRGLARRSSIGVVDCANAYPCLVICPSSLKINWQREFEKFTNKHALVLRQLRAYHMAVPPQNGYAAGGHRQLRVPAQVFRVGHQGGLRGGFRLKDVVFTPDIKLFKSIIIDESHRVKDPSAQQTIFAWHCRGKEYRILLSGTPVVNRPADLIAQLSIMGRLPEFGGRSSFLPSMAVERLLRRRNKEEEDAPRNLERLCRTLLALHDTPRKG